MMALPMGHDARPHILFAIADDWGWPHAGVYGDPVVQTPTFDRVAREGVLFSAGLCVVAILHGIAGARILTGQYHWRLEGVANLASVFPDKFATFPELLEQSGYEIGFRNKGWGPGVTETPDRQLIGKRFEGFHDFLQAARYDQAVLFLVGKLRSAPRL